MKDHIERTIGDLQAKLRIQEDDVLQTKRLINLLCKEANLDPMYDDTDATSASLFSIRQDQFFGRPLATVIKEYLNMRLAANKGAATVNEIYDTLCRGGYAFQAKNDDNAKRGIQISLGKNRYFMRVPNGSWGLSAWYPSARAGKNTNGKPNTDEAASASESAETIDEVQPTKGAQTNA